MGVFGLMRSTANPNLDSATLSKVSGLLTICHLVARHNQLRSRKWEYRRSSKTRIATKELHDSNGAGKTEPRIVCRPDVGSSCLP